MTNPSSLPQIDFTTFVLSIASAALYSMGVQTFEAKPGEDAKLPVDLDMAKHNIDLLVLLQEKTKGNRTADEDRLLEQLLFETRMRFVDLQKKQEGK